MKKLLVVVTLCLIGCQSPSADYIKADQATWAQYDPYIDTWVDSATFPGLKADEVAGKKDALHQLNKARRARIDHAIASINS